MSKRDVTDFEENQVRAAFAEAYCLTAVVRALGMVPNGTTHRLATALQVKYQIDTSHFDKRKGARKYAKVEKSCPVCQTVFESSTSPKARATCSYGCANTFFRSGENNGKWKSTGNLIKYTTVCWRYHKKCCVVCGENKIVAAHHHNGIHTDNRPENLVPLCPTHHVYWHSKYRYLVKDKIVNYINEFKLRNMGP